MDGAKVRQGMACAQLIVLGKLLEHMTPVCRWLGLMALENEKAPIKRRGLLLKEDEKRSSPQMIIA